MFFRPEMYETHDYLVKIGREDVDICQRLYTEECEDFSGDIKELVKLIKPDYVQPSDEVQALKLIYETTEYLKSRWILSYK